LKASHQLRRKTITTLSRRAFTLVEVVLALGVTSFGLISMLGLLTVGLKTFHDTMSVTTETEIAQQMANQLELANYSSLSSQPASTNYCFTQEGLLTNATSAVYFAKVSAPTLLTIPGGSTSSTVNTNTLTFVISIWCVNSPQTTNAIAIQIANNGS
jgi:uncharacterized protein (TIGR02598 family)